MSAPIVQQIISSLRLLKGPEGKNKKYEIKKKKEIYIVLFI